MIILDFWWQLLLGGVLVYLLCNINYAVLISKTFKKKERLIYQPFHFICYYL